MNEKYDELIYSMKISITELLQIYTGPRYIKIIYKATKNKGLIKIPRININFQSIIRVELDGFNPKF